MLVEDLRVSSTKASQLTSWAVLGVGFGVWRQPLNQIPLFLEANS